MGAGRSPSQDIDCSVSLYGEPWPLNTSILPPHPEVVPMFIKCVALVSIAMVLISNPRASDETVVASLDEAYQAAVKANDAAGMDSILAPDFALVTGKGANYNRNDLLDAARNRAITYEHQEDTQRTVRVYGNTAVVTALLWMKGTRKTGEFDSKLWFSDVYVRTPRGWKYVFGQASLALPN
jgi:ketosteroid isomerase-like protein